MKQYKKIEKFGYIFKVEVTETGKPGKFERDLIKVAAILEKPVDQITPAEHIILLNIYNVAFHEGGKIEGVYSLDSSATNCTFCEKMRKAAMFNPDIICGMCYDYKQEHSFKGVNVLNRHTLNMLIMSKVEFAVEELAALPGIGIVRVNSSGDAENKIYACNMIKYAIAHKYAAVAIWSKNVSSYIYACDTYGKPENVVMIQSSIFVNKPGKLAKYFDYMFTVYNDAATVNNALSGGACECNGKKCKNCGYKCYFKSWKQGANIAELLRK